MVHVCKDLLRVQIAYWLPCYDIILYQSGVFISRRDGGVPETQIRINKYKILYFICYIFIHIVHKLLKKHRLHVKLIVNKTKHLGLLAS